MLTVIKSRELEKDGRPMRNMRQLSQVVVGATLLVGANTAWAAPHILQLADGNNAGPREDNGGPGQEQPTSVHMNVGGKEYVVTVYMSSKVSDTDRPYQCKCTSIEMNPMTGPTIVADQIQITARHGGDRPCNHTAAATDGKYVVWSFGSDSGPGSIGNTQTYTGVLDNMCNELAAPIRVSNNNNNNQGAPDLVYQGAGMWVNGYYDNNAGRTYARGLTLDDSSGTPVLTKHFLTVTTTPSNIGRPTIATIAPDRALVCAAKGDQRPPEDGVECTLINSTDGTVIWKNLIAPSDPDNKLYMNQPTLALMDNGRVALSVVSSTGEGRRKNKKGTSQAYLYMIQPSDAGIGFQQKLDAVGEYQAHSSLCSGAYGVDGKPTMAVFDASITGSGLAQMQMIQYDPTTKAFLPIEKRAASSENGDSGYLANIYGQNPHQQGRDFLKCMGDVPNPGYGVTGGYEPLVKTFFIAPHMGRIMGQQKDAMFMTFMPAHVDQVIPPDDPPTPPAPTPPVDPITTGDPTGGTGHEHWGEGGTGSSGPPSMFGCSVGHTSTGGALGSMLLVGMAILIVRRKRS